MKAQKVFEVGEATILPANYSVEEIHNDSYRYIFKTENEEYEVFLIKVPVGEFYIYTLDFRKVDDHDNRMINKGDLYVVMSTIVKIANDFINEKNPKRILIMPKDFRRLNLFKRFVDKNLRNDWSSTIIEFDGKDCILLRDNNR